MNRDAAFIYSDELENYHYPPECPFKTERAAMTRETLESMGLLSGVGRRRVAPEPADRQVVEKFHTSRYLNVLLDAQAGDMGIEGLNMGLGTPETPVFKVMYDYAILACGATLTGMNLLLDGENRIAFNPSGGYHHARPEKASGFCYINDVALACLLLGERVDRVLFLDVDGHHCDGVQDAFYERSDVMTISLHETGETLFPGTGQIADIGRGEGEGFSVNIPMLEGTYNAPDLQAFGELVPPLVEAYDPDAIVFEVGMDGLSGDPLVHLSLTNQAYAEVAERVIGFDRPLLVTGGGGYHPENTARGWALLWSILCGGEAQPDLNVGMGGVMLESTEWRGGLRDRTQVVDEEQQRRVQPQMDAVIESVKKHIFPLHGL